MARMLQGTTRKPEPGTQISLINYQLLEEEEVQTRDTSYAIHLWRCWWALVSDTEPIGAECSLQLDDILHTLRVSHKMFSN